MKTTHDLLEKIATMRRERDQLDVACTQWMEVSQENYQRAKTQQEGARE